MTLNRRGINGVDGFIDKLHYFYDGNKLKGVNDDVSMSVAGNDFRDNGQHYVPNGQVEFEYDANGNMIYDSNKGIIVTYNMHNLPTRVEYADHRKIEWIYDSNGSKLRKTVSTSDNAIVSYTDYLGAIEYLK